MCLSNCHDATATWLTSHFGIWLFLMKLKFVCSVSLYTGTSVDVLTYWGYDRNTSKHIIGMTVNDKDFQSFRGKHFCFCFCFSFSFSFSFSFLVFLFFFLFFLGGGKFTRKKLKWTDKYNVCVPQKWTISKVAQRVDVRVEVIPSFGYAAEFQHKYAHVLWIDLSTGARFRDSEQKHVWASING